MKKLGRRTGKSEQRAVRVSTAAMVTKNDRQNVAMTRRFSLTILAALVALSTLSGIPGEGRAARAEADSTEAAPVVHWSREAQRAIVPAGPGGIFGSENYGNKFPGEAAVYMGIVHAAIYDAAVAIDGRYHPYAIRVSAGPEASLPAAVATAAHHVLVGLQPALGLTPTQQAGLDQRYADYLAAIRDGAAKTDGIDVGERVAQGLLVLRADDGRSENPQYGQPPFEPPPSGPGVWNRGSAPAVGLRMPGIRPLALESASQVRPDGPNSLASDAYAEDFEQVKRLGGAASTARTEEQKTVARFWTDHDLRQWNDGMLGLAATRRLDPVETARLLAMAHVAGGDAMIGCFDAKYHYWFWRPYQAMPLADTDGNPSTEADTAWQPLLPTPNFPEYPSAHACHTSALATALQAFFGTDRITFSLDSRITGTTRSYDRLYEVVKEVNRARLLAGFHFFNSNQEGSHLGRKVGRHVVNNLFQSVGEGN